MPKFTYDIQLDDSEFSWILEAIEYEIDYFKKLGSDCTEGDTEQLRVFQRLHQKLEVATPEKN